MCVARTKTIFQFGHFAQVGTADERQRLSAFADASIEADMKRERERKERLAELGEDAEVKEEDEVMEEEEDPVPEITIEHFEEAMRLPGAPSAIKTSAVLLQLLDEHDQQCSSAPSECERVRFT
ncbi:hypothetical protein JCM5296_004195 [Sporobolomyces johnsonii]